MELLRREFAVDLPREQAWARLADVSSWPRWAKHIRRIDVDPPGPVGPSSKGAIVLRNGIRSVFAMTAWEPPDRWLWTGPFLWLAVRYDHRFEPAGDGTTRLTWIVDAEGFGVGIFGRLFARIYGRNLDRAIPRLQEELR